MTIVNINKLDISRDLLLAKAALEGDEQAWRQIYDNTHTRLYNFLCYQAGDRDAARDLLQETYLVAFTHLKSYRGRGSLLAWLRKVALRKCLDWRRRVALRLRKMAALARELTPALGEWEPENFPGLGDGLQRALDRLSPHQRAALLLHELEGLPFVAVAEGIGCSEATARVHHHRACHKLRRWLVDIEKLSACKQAGEIT